jgi:hypothetical protein
MTPAHEAIEVSCSEYIGKPISSRIAAFGPPNSVYRISATQVGYVFKTKETAYVGGEPYYTVNYLTGADKHRTPVRKISRVCQGVYVVHAPSDALPASERIIVDVLPQDGAARRCRAQAERGMEARSRLDGAWRCSSSGLR